MIMIMDIFDFITTYYNAFKAYPIHYLSSNIILFLLGYKTASLLFNRQICILNERLDQYKDRLNHSNTDKDLLLEKLDQYGANIDKIQNELEARPKIHIGDTPPDDKSSFWYDTNNNTQE